MLKVKRVCDVIISLFSIIALFPLFVIIAILIKRDSEGSIFFFQERPGYKGKLFKIYKFRTMLNQKNLMIKGKEVLKDDPRVTRIGKFLRRFKLDELPQLFNILKGDMSLIGPRPERIESLNEYTPEIMRRLNMKPGLTGLAQVNGNIYLSLNERYKYDVQYVDEYSFILDIKIFLKTFIVLILGEKALL